MNITKNILLEKCKTIHFWLEAVSKFQIAFKGKAPLDDKAKHIKSYVSILKKAATPLLDVRWDFETASNDLNRSPI